MIQDSLLIIPWQQSYTQRNTTLQMFMRSLKAYYYENLVPMLLWEGSLTCTVLFKCPTLLRQRAFISVDCTTWCDAGAKVWNFIPNFIRSYRFNRVQNLSYACKKSGMDCSLHSAAYSLCVVLCAHLYMGCAAGFLSFLLLLVALSMWKCWF